MPRAGKGGRRWSDRRRAAIVPGMVVEHDIMVTARDGVPLATDVYRPEGLGPIATRLPTARDLRQAQGGSVVKS